MKEISLEEMIEFISYLDRVSKEIIETVGEPPPFLFEPFFGDGESMVFEVYPWIGFNIKEFKIGEKIDTDHIQKQIENSKPKAYVLCSKTSNKSIVAKDIFELIEKIDSSF